MRAAGVLFSLALSLFAARFAEAQSHGVPRIGILSIRQPSDLPSAFAAIAKARVDALVPLAEPLTPNPPSRVSEFALKNRLPMMAEARDLAEAGGLITYGPSLVDLWWRAAMYVDKILKGTKPADLAVEQPTKFEMVVNLKTAKAIGLIRADEVIQ